MIRYLIDTDHLTLIEKAHATVTSNLTTRTAEEVATSVVSVEESLRGRLAMIARATTGLARVRQYREFRESFELIGQLQILDYSETAENLFLSLRVLKLLIGSRDLKIASIALANSLIVVTRNRRDFGRVPGLSIEDWSAP